MLENGNLDLAEIELIQSALQYYATGSAYPGKRGNIRQERRADRAAVLAFNLSEQYKLSIDETGDGSTVGVILE